MASPQIENGYTAIANDIMDALCHIRIPGEARQVLDSILRKTYGWHKKEDGIPLSQFVEMTGINRPNICRSINMLVDMNIIIKKDNGIIKKDNELWTTYSFQKDFEKWKPLSKKITLSKKIMTVIEKDNEPLSKKIHSKETLQKQLTKTNKVILPDWLDQELWNEFLNHRKKLRKPMTEYAQKLAIKKLTWMKDKGHNPRSLIMTAIESGWQTFYEPKES